MDKEKNPRTTTDEPPPGDSSKKVDTPSHNSNPTRGEILLPLTYVPPQQQHVGTIRTTSAESLTSTTDHDQMDREDDGVVTAGRRRDYSNPDAIEVDGSSQRSNPSPDEKELFDKDPGTTRRDQASKFSADAVFVRDTDTARTSNPWGETVHRVIDQPLDLLLGGYPSIAGVLGLGISGIPGGPEYNSPSSKPVLRQGVWSRRYKDDKARGGHRQKGEVIGRDGEVETHKAEKEDVGKGVEMAEDEEEDDPEALWGRRN